MAISTRIDTALYGDRDMDPAVKAKVYFHPEQVKYLEKLFPSVVLLPSASEAEMRYHFGQQSVVQKVRELSK